MMQHKKRQTFVETEDKLLADTAGTYHKELLNKLLQFDSEINVKIHDPSLTNETFNRYNEVKTAIQNAKMVLEKSLTKLTQNP